MPPAMGPSSPRVAFASDEDDDENDEDDDEDDSEAASIYVFSRLLVHLSPPKPKERCSPRSHSISGKSCIPCPDGGVAIECTSIQTKCKQCITPVDTEV